MYHEEEEEEEERESGSSQSSSTETPPPPLASWLAPLYQMTSPVRTCQSYSVDVPGTSQGLFVPTVTAITTSQDLQWMVQSTVITSSASSQSVPRVPPPAYAEAGPAGVPPRRQEVQAEQPGPSGVQPRGHQAVSRPRGGRRRRDEELGPEEAERRRIRRERNKQAAARCRNRRRELTERLQAETDALEDQSSGLRAEIETLGKEKERLQLVLVAHRGFCKMSREDDLEDCTLAASAQLVCSVPPPCPSRSEADPASRQQPERAEPPLAGADISGSYYFDFEPIAGPSSSAASAAAPAGGSFPSTSGYRPFLLQGAQQGVAGGQGEGAQAAPPPLRGPGSSNGEQSSDSLSSPTLLAL